MDGAWEWITNWANDNLSDFTLTKVYIGCAVAGGTVIVGQTGLNLFGLGGDTDVDPDMDVDDLDGGDSLSFLSIRALSGFLTFFGLVGWLGTSKGWGAGVSALAAFAAGCSVMIMLALLMRFFRRLGSDGNMHMQNTVGLNGNVYLKVPASNAGRGKVTLTIQGRTHEFEALTRGPELPTNTPCRVIRVISDGLLEIASLDSEER